MHTGTKFCQNPLKTQRSVASTLSRTPFRSHLVTSFAPERSMQRCLSHNVPVCPAMCLPASKCLCLHRNCKDMDLLLALQLATSEGNNVFNRGSSRQSSHKVIHASHRSQIAAASQPHRRKTYRHLARLLQKSIDASKSQCSPWAKGYIDPDCCAECIAIQSPQLSYDCHGGQSMGESDRRTVTKKA